MTGGGIEAGECPEEAARREVLEETGFEVGDLIGPVLERTAEFDFEADHYRQHEVYWLARVDAFDVDEAGRNAMEQRSVTGHRWWSLDELRRTADTVFPEGLADVLQEVLRGEG